MAYPEKLIIPMRDDLTRYGIEETRTPADVDRVLAEKGTVMMVVNSVCGCAAGKARPGIGMALRHGVRPDKAATVFAGADEEAVAHLRGILSDYPPSSPSIGPPRSRSTGSSSSHTSAASATLRSRRC